MRVPTMRSVPLYLLIQSVICRQTKLNGDILIVISLCATRMPCIATPLALTLPVKETNDFQRRSMLLAPRQVSLTRYKIVGEKLLE